MISCKELDGKLFRYYWIIFLAFSDLHVFSVKSPVLYLSQTCLKITEKFLIKILTLFSLLIKLIKRCQNRI